MKKQRLIFTTLILLLFAATLNLYSQDSGRRYTFIAKDGSQLINVFLVQEKENTYIIQINDENKHIVIKKKNIEKLIQVDSEIPAHFKPVIGKKSDMVLSPDKLSEKDNSDAAGDYYISIGLSGYGISNLDSSTRYNSGGWGGELLAVLGFKKPDYFQAGLGMNYNRFDSSVPEKSSSISLYCLYGYFQLSDKPEMLSFDNFKLRPFIGADLGGALLYKYSRSEDDEENESRVKKIYPKEPYYGFRFGIGITPEAIVPVEFILSMHYSVIADNDISSFAKISLGINYYF